MATISKDNNGITLINVFTMKSEDQQHLLDVLIRATQEVMAKLPGFLSANFHKSLDGTRVVNYAQWTKREAFQAMLSNPAVQAHMAEAMKLATFDANLYEVIYKHKAGDM